MGPPDDAEADVLLNLCGLVPTNTPVPPGLHRDSERVLREVDGSRTLPEIAAATNLSLGDVLKAYVELLGVGLLDAPEATP